MRLVDTLSEITADLVEFEENELFLNRLFSLEPGTWGELDCLCDGLDGYQARLKKIKKAFQETVRVTWLPYPVVGYGDGYGLIIFFAEQQQWHNVALHNKQQLAHPLAKAEFALMQAA
jgi:hypothetical protein